MRIACPCGEVLVDSGNELPFKAHLRPDEDDVRYTDAVVDEVGRISRRFRDAPDDSAEFQLKLDLQELGMVGVQFERPVYECGRCGRLLLFLPGRESFATYTPETSIRDVLRSDA